RPHFSVEGQLAALGVRSCRIGCQRIAAIVGRGVELEVDPIDVKNIGGVVDAAEQSALGADLIILGLVRLINEQVGTHLEGAPQRNGIGAAATKSFCVVDVGIQRVADLVRGVELGDVA